MKIEDDTFWDRINYTHAIRRIFNPEYQVAEENTIGEWISEEDVADCGLNFVGEVWRCSDPLAQKILKGFEEW